LINKSRVKVKLLGRKMLCKRNYKVVITMGFLLHQSNVLKCSWLMLYSDWTLIRAIETSTYYVLFFMKGSNCSYKLRYEGYL